MADEFYRKQSEIMKKYRDQREPIENIAYAQLTTLREPVDDSPFGEARYKIVNHDGDESSGADYTALDGTVYKGKNTYYDEYYNEQEQFYGQMNALYTPVQKLEKYVDGAFVRENIASEFENDFGFSSDNWSPAKSGDGVRRGDDSFVDPFANEIKPGLGAQDGDELASSLSGGGYGNYYDVGGGDFRGIDQIMRMYNDPQGNQKYGDKMMKNIKQIMLDLDLVKEPDSGLGSVASVGGVDATAAATAAASNRQTTRKKKKKRGTTSMVAHYQPIGSDLLEKYARPQPKKQLERLKSKGFFNPKDIKPTFPPNDPPELDPKTKMHPNYGKQAGRYKRLDPISANAMPPTGDPEIDAVVDKQKTKPKTKKQKYLAKVVESKKYTWREDFTNITTGMKVGQTFRHNPSGQTVTTGGALGGIETVPSTVSIFGDSIPGPTVSQYGLQGFAKPILMKRRDAEDTNKKLDASQEFAQKVGADVMMNARVERRGTAKISDKQKRINKAAETFIRYLTNQLPEGKWNDYMGKDYVKYAFGNGYLNDKGGITVGDNVIGSASSLTFDEKSGKYRMNFKGLGVDDNLTQFSKGDYSLWKKAALNQLGIYAADLQPAGLPWWLAPVQTAIGAGASRVLEFAKLFGGGKDVDAFIEIDPNELHKLNPQLAYDIEQRNLESDGFDTGHGYSAPPPWLDSWARKTEFSGDLRSLWNNKTRTWNLGGKIVDNDGNPIKKATTPKPSKSKSVERIKSMAKTKRQSLSLDEPVVRSSKKSKKKEVDK